MNSAVLNVFTRAVSGLLVALALATVTGCGGGGAGTEALPNTGTVTSSNYNGPSPKTEDVQLFKLNVWDNLVGSNRCGSCHGTGGQSPQFVRSDNINSAYEAANTVVNLNEPSESTMVQKVGGGHNCWLSSPQACADTITQYITRWAGGSTGEVQRVVLQSVTDLQDPGETLTLSDDSSDYSALYDLFTGPAKCSRCHSQDSTGQKQSPYFADTSQATRAANLAMAYDAAKSKIDVNSPELSRFYIRLKNESHNCWTDCDSDAQAILDLIVALAGSLETTALPDGTISSKLSPKLADGTPASSGGRYESNVIAKWEFKTGDGTIAYDTSGVEPAINLNLIGDVSWVGGWGISLNGGKAQGTTASSKKVHDLIKTTGEYSVEAWVAPGNVTQEGPAVIVNYGGSDIRRNFTIGQTMYNYDYLHRSSTTGLNGDPALSTPDGDEVLQATLQHVVATFSPSAGRKLYVNGRLIDEPDPSSPGNLVDWNDTYALVMGSEPSGANVWQGTIRMVAIHNRALTAEQIENNYDVGVGQKFYLLFNISEHIDLPESYIVFEVSQFDSYSYLFNAPFFISLDSNVTPENISIGGMRIGINGEEAKAGQAFTNLLVDELDSAYYTPEQGEQLSNVGTIIGLKSGPDNDQFFLIFDELNGETGVVSDPGDKADHLAIDIADSPQPRIGVRNFGEISASMAKLTGVTPEVVNSQFDNFSEFERSMPADDNALSFVPSHPVAITQLAILYCDALINDTSLRDGVFDSGLFSGADFSGPDKNTLIDNLYDAFIGNGFEFQPENADVEDAVGTLVDNLAADCAGSCNSTQTANVVKGACAAVLGSATMMVQ
ncbi:hypothetical protein BTA51_11060 [Hahella sp. CCB-MM4]|nr:hypothetical protein BTA51_11060 [Hahella sp. CCB-MM4]